MRKGLILYIRAKERFLLINIMLLVLIVSTSLGQKYIFTNKITRGIGWWR